MASSRPNRKNEARSIIEETLTSRNKSPGLIDLTKMVILQHRLEACASIGDLFEMLENNRNLICRSFGLSDAIFDDGVGKLKSMA